jgi:hypothetical protein
VHANTDAHDATKGAAMKRLRELETALTARGFKVRVEPHSWALVARNVAAEPEDPLGKHFAPALAQRVQVSTDDKGALNWYWQWSGPTRDAPPEYELLCPAAAIAEATERIARVLALAAQ